MKNIDKDPMQLAIAVLNHNDGVPFVKEAIKLGLMGGLISPATGLIGSPLLNLLSIRHDRRDFVMMFERKSIMEPAIQSIVKQFKMDKPNHGVVFVLDTKFNLRRDCLIGANDWNNVHADHQLVFITFKHGRSKEVIEKLTQVSTAGATIFTGKGEHVAERQQMLGLSFSPQKDVVMSVVESQQVPDVFNAIEEAFYCSNTKGMSVFSLELNSFSQEKEVVEPLNMPKKSLLISVVSEELEEEYLKIMKKHRMNGGTSIKGHGSISPEMMERIFNITVNPQKRILFTVDDTNKVQEAYEDILQTRAMNEKHRGIFLTIPVKQAYGMYDKTQQHD
ncbi:hypothetical protein JXA27_03935 [Aerococcaceae bacterium zg-B36]|uniref:hypothetical protein n=1 Tax=Aerococcaceae bacterium zg-252 TaxID=2796928 RepID=UPI001BD909C3|nr:hypothetical protein [Aerococcaceae bacterium zg-B36]